MRPGGAIDNMLLDRKVGYVYLVTQRDGDYGPARNNRLPNAAR